MVWVWEELSVGGGYGGRGEGGGRRVLLSALFCCTFWIWDSAGPRKLGGGHVPRAQTRQRRLLLDVSSCTQLAFIFWLFGSNGAYDGFLFTATLTNTPCSTLSSLCVVNDEEARHNIQAFYARKELEDLIY